MGGCELAGVVVQASNGALLDRGNGSGLVGNDGQGRDLDSGEGHEGDGTDDGGKSELHFFRVLEEGV